MRVADVQDRVKLVAGMSHDDETAHHQEDRLHQDVLRAIADGADNAQELAAAALLTLDLTHARWCA